jgi:transposase
VRTEAVPWARPGARHSRDFQDLVAWLAQRADKTTVARLVRISWEAVADIVVAVVDEHLSAARLDGLRRLGVDEIHYRGGHRFLTVVADHDQGGAVVWVGEGHRTATLEAFYDELGPERTARLEAISLDLGAPDTKAPGLRQCVDPFHVVALANRALDRTRLNAWYPVHRIAQAERRPAHRPRKDAPPSARPAALWLKHSRWALLKDPDSLSESQLAVLHQLRRDRSVVYRGWQLKEALRDLYRLADAADAPAHLDWWLAWACRSRIPAFVTLSKTVRTNRDRILAAVELELSNSALEGLNSKIRLINHRGYGHRTVTTLAAMIYLCCGGITVELPQR